MKKILKRYKYKKSFYKSLCFQNKSKKIYIDLNNLKKKLKVDGIIKFLPFDFKFLKIKFYHFNLEYADHKKNKHCWDQSELPHFPLPYPLIHPEQTSLLQLILFLN